MQCSMDRPAALKAPQLAQPIPSFLKKLNFLPKEFIFFEQLSEGSSADPEDKDLLLAAGDKTALQSNQISFSQPHRKVIADAAHPKGTARKSSQSAR